MATCMCVNVCVYVHAYCHVCPWERDDVYRAKRCISQRSISGPFLAATCRVPRSSLPVHQAPVMSQRTVGGERRAYKGRRSVYLSLAVLASDGGSRLTKGNVVNVDWSEQVDGKKGGQRRGGVARVMFKKDACYANGWWICCGWARCPRLMDGAAEVTSGSGWSGAGKRAQRPAEL